MTTTEQIQTAITGGGYFSTLTTENGYVVTLLSAPRDSDAMQREMAKGYIKHKEQQCVTHNNEQKTTHPYRADMTIYELINLTLEPCLVEG